MTGPVPPADRPPITQVLQQLAAGEAGASDQLLSLVYEELHKLARRRMAEQTPGQTLQATALVHEAWMRLEADGAVRWDNRAHFFGAAARAMRFILVEQARRKSRKKRGGDRHIEALPTEIAAPQVDNAVDLEALDEALNRLERVHPCHARLVTLRYFGGLAMHDIAETLGVSVRTAERDWSFARAWLRCALADADAGG